jgi:hypothetical protein
LPYSSKKPHKRSKDANAHNPSETVFPNPLGNSSPYWVRVYIKWNDPILLCIATQNNKNLLFVLGI